MKTKHLLKKSILAILLIATTTLYGQVGIGTNNPDNSSVLEIQSTTKGFLPPRMTETQALAILNPALGLIVYCTDCSPKGFYYFNGDRFLNATNGLISGFDANEHVVSATGKVWANRNLGASQVATSSTDTNAYGDLYQWGRTTDGHQLRTSATAAGPVVSGTEGSNYITLAVAGDWLSTSDDTRWNGTTKGVHDPCPTGYRVPTEAEWNAEISSWTSNDIDGAFASPLKLTLAGIRLSDGNITNTNVNGFYWAGTNSTSNSNPHRLQVNSSAAGMSTTIKNRGLSVRCIQQ
jgi:hypothetical protein